MISLISAQYKHKKILHTTYNKYMTTIQNTLNWKIKKYTTPTNHTPFSETHPITVRAFHYFIFIFARFFRIRPRIRITFGVVAPSRPFVNHIRQLLSYQTVSSHPKHWFNLIRFLAHAHIFVSCFIFGRAFTRKTDNLNFALFLYDAECVRRG